MQFITLLLSACLASTAYAAQEKQMIDFQLRWHNQFQFAGYYAALEKGYYSDEGLDVRLHEGAPGRTPVDEVLAGRAQYAESNSELLLGRMQGKPLVALAAIFQHSPSVLLAKKDSGINSPHDLIGKKVMLMNVTTDADFLAMFLHEGVKHSAINIIPSSYNFKDLMAGKVDAFNSYLTNEAFFLQKQGIDYTIINPSSYGIDFYSDILFTTEQEIKQNPQRVDSFRRATLKGWQYAMSHPDEIIELLISKYKVPKSREHLKFEADNMRSLILPDLVEIGHMNPGRWQHMADAFIDVGMGNKEFKIDGFIYDPSPKQLPGWVSRTIILTLLLTLIFSLASIYLFRLNRRLFLAQEKLQMAASVFEISNDAVLLTDPENRIISVNPAFTLITGYQPEEVLGKNPTLLASGTHDKKFYQNMWTALNQSGSWAGEIFNRRKNGEIYAEWLSIKKQINSDGKLVSYVSIFSDISERKAAEKYLERMAHYDFLTGLPNRILFKDRLKQAAVNANREQGRVALLFLDLDMFKPINDKHGHHIGDLLLKEAANRLLECIRATDTACRLGGDEFVVLLSSVDGDEDAEVVAEKIRHKLNMPFIVGEHNLLVSSSIGIAIYPQDSNDEEQLLKAADAAMYHAKQSGRNQVQLYKRGMIKNEWIYSI
jgi:diguanylate cyclase (GGDEF)-like protein/PAS domain S-box-containing protein